MAKNMKIKKGDVVRVIAGKDKGAEGKVISVLPDQDRVVVEGVNRIKRHTKVVNQGGRAGTTGGIITAEAAIHVSNVMLLVDAPKDSDVKGKVTTRVGYRRDDVTKRRPDGSTYAAQRSTRVARKSGEEI
ncbi:MAG: 50S ribosomal protein L24 [Nocardioidaceae bacterium]